MCQNYTVSDGKNDTVIIFVRGIQKWRQREENFLRKSSKREVISEFLKVGTENALYKV